MENLTFRDIEIFMSGKGRDVVIDDEFYQKYGLKDANGEFNMMGRLLSDQNPSVMKVITYHGMDRGVIDYTKEFGGKSILTCLVYALNYINSINEVLEHHQDGRSGHTPLFSKHAFYEAWIYACVHNTWRNGTPPSIGIFDDRLEIMAYGDLDNHPLDRKVDEYPTVPFTMILPMIFIDTGLVDRLESDFMSIIKGRENSPFKTSFDRVRVTIPFAFEPKVVSLRKSSSELHSQLTDNQSKVFEYLCDHPDSTLSNIVDDLSIPLPGVKYAITVLIKKGLVIRVGSKRYGKWVVQSSKK